jgi:phosphatidylethanolamine-binding protein (PEBP) family uncharacterized protein
MKPITFALPVGCGLLVWSIGSTVLAEQAKLQINFSWAQTERCTTVSPEIHVSSVPEGTKKFEVALQDLDVPTYRHGGGTVPANAGVH